MTARCVALFGRRGGRSREDRWKTEQRSRRLTIPGEAGCRQHSQEMQKTDRAMVAGRATEPKRRGEWTPEIHQESSIGRPALATGIGLCTQSLWTPRGGLWANIVSRRGSSGSTAAVQGGMHYRGTPHCGHARPACGSMPGACCTAASRDVPNAQVAVQRAVLGIRRIMMCRTQSRAEGGPPDQPKQGAMTLLPHMNTGWNINVIKLPELLLGMRQVWNAPRQSATMRRATGQHGLTLLQWWYYKRGQANKTSIRAHPDRAAAQWHTAA